MCVTWTENTATGRDAIRKAQLQPALPIYCGIAAEAGINNNNILLLQLGCHPVAVHIYTQEQHRTTQLTNDNTKE